jgi:predicted peptidase
MLPRLWTHSLVLALLIAAVQLDSSQEDTVMLFKITELKSGLKLRYTLSLPQPYSPATSYPLVVALHYGGKVTPYYSKDFLTSLIEPALKDLRAIMVVPDCPSAGWTNALSESSVLELILLLMEEYNIDSDRLVILGYSLGGSGTWYMAARHPHLFSAAIPISAPMEKATIPIIEHVPLHIIHGENDELFPSSEVRSIYQEQKRGGAEVQLTIVPGAGHYQLARFINPLKATIPWIKKIWEYR